jgi:hypothetical protein
MIGRLVWEREEQWVRTTEELQAALERLASSAKKRPFIVELFGESGASISIGLGRDISVVNVASAGGNPPYWQSVRKENESRYREMSLSGDDGEPIVFYYGGQWSEFPPTSGVPTVDALRAMQEFFRKEELPDHIQWLEV